MNTTPSTQRIESKSLELILANQIIGKRIRVFRIPKHLEGDAISHSPHFYPGATELVAEIMEVSSDSRKTTFPVKLTLSIDGEIAWVKLGLSETIVFV